MRCVANPSKQTRKTFLKTSKAVGQLDNEEAKVNLKENEDKQRSWMNSFTSVLTSKN